MSGAAAERVLVFVKAPRPGAVKTRLARTVGAPAAAALYRRIAETILEETTDPEGRWRTVVCFEPPEAGDELERWLGTRIPLFPQRGDDLGQRMSAALDAAFGSGASRAVLVGSDVPGLSRARLAEAFEALHMHDLVLGPSLDGGYYLIGLRESRPGLFEGVEWSSPRVLEQTLARAAGLSVHRLPLLRDLDRIEDLRAEWPRLRPLLEGTTLAELERVVGPTS